MTDPAYSVVANATLALVKAGVDADHWQCITKHPVLQQALLQLCCDTERVFAPLTILHERAVRSLLESVYPKHDSLGELQRQYLGSVDQLNELLSRLEDKHRLVVVLLFGLLDGEPREKQTIVWQYSISSAAIGHSLGRANNSIRRYIQSCQYRAEKEAEQAALAKRLAEDPYTVVIGELDFSVRAYNCFERESIHNIGSLLKRSEADILMLPGMNEPALEDTKKKLAALGVAFPRSTEGK